MELYIIVGIIVLLLLFIIISVSSTKRKMRREIIKINDAIESIDLYLGKKKDALYRSKNIIKDDDYKNNFKDELNYDDNTELNDILNDLENKFYEIIDEDEELTKNKKLLNLKIEIRNIDNNLLGSIKFYNDSLEKYYKIKTTFPTNIVKVFCGFKKYNKFETKRTNTD